jgi:hypothetical protein
MRTRKEPIEAAQGDEAVKRPTQKVNPGALCTSDLTLVT